MIDDLLLQLRQTGLVDSEGHFTLNAARAREKLQQYQFRDPHEYVLSLYRAAVLSGATRFECRTDADDCILEWNGEPLTETDLQSFWGTLFVRFDDPALARLRFLALGVNAALGLQPAFLTLASGGVQVRYEGTSERREETSVEGTRIHVRERSSWKVAQRLLQRKSPPEAQLLATLAGRGPAVTTVNGKLHHYEVGLPAAAFLKVHLQDPDPRTHLPSYVPAQPRALGFSAVLALVPRNPLNEVEFLSAGLGAGRRALFPDLVGTVSVLDLPLNASQSYLVVGERLEELTERLAELRTEFLVSLAQADPDEETRAFLAQAALTVDVLEHFPLLRTASGGRVSVAELRARGVTLPFTRREWRLPEEHVSAVVHVTTPDEFMLLERLGRVELADEMLEQLEAGVKRQDRWRDAPVLPARIGTAVLARVPLQELDGELALVSKGPSLCHLRREGKLLHCEEMIGFPDRLVAVVEHPRLRMDPTWTRVVHDEAWDEVQAVLGQAVHGLFTSLDGLTPRMVWEYLDFAASWPVVGPMAQRPAVRTVDGAVLPLQRLEGERLFYVQDGVKLPLVQGWPRPAPVLELSLWELEVLAKALPGDCLVPAREHPDLLRLLNLPRFEQRAPRVPEPPALERFAQPDGFLAVMEGGYPGLTLVVLCRERELCRLELDWPLGPLLAHLSLPEGVLPTPEWDGVEDSPRWQARLAELREDAWQMGLGLAKRPEPVRRFLLRMLAGEARRCEPLRLEPPAELMRARIFLDVQGTNYSAEELLRKHPRIPYTTAAREAALGIVRVEPSELEDFRAVFGASRVVDRTAELAAAAPVALPEGDYVATVVGKGFRLGLPRDLEPGEVLLCCHGEVVERQQGYGNVPYAGVLDDLKPDAGWKRVVRDKRYHDLQLEVNRALLRAVAELDDVDYQVRLLRTLTVGLSAHQELAVLPVLEGWREPIILSEWERRTSAGPPPWISPECAAELGPLVVDWEKLERRLQAVNPVVGRQSAGRCLDQKAREGVAIQQFEQRPRVDLRLAGGPWLAEVSIPQGDSLYGGTLALAPAWEGPGEIRLAHKAIPVGTLDPGLGIAVHGVVSGYFPPSEDFSGIRDERAARELLLPHLMRLVQAAVPALPDEERGVLVLRVWRQVLPPHREVLENYRFFPLEGGRTANLEGLLQHPQIAYTLDARGSFEGPTLRLEGQPRLAAELEAALPDRLAQAPVTGGLVERLRSEFRLLGARLPEGFRLGLGRRPDRVLCWTDAAGVWLNEGHRAVQRALPAGAPPRFLYLLLSAVYSAVNRAEVDVTDADERAFHARLLAAFGLGLGAEADGHGRAGDELDRHGV